MKIPVSNARCTIGPAVGHRVAVSVGGGGISPVISTWQVAKLCRDVRWDVKEFTHHLPKAFCYGGKVLRCEQVGGGVEKINIFSVM